MNGDGASFADWMSVIFFWTIPAIIALVVIVRVVNGICRRAENVPLQTKLLVGFGLWSMHNHGFGLGQHHPQPPTPPVHPHV